jgi:hypothetical protein
MKAANIYAALLCRALLIMHSGQGGDSVCLDTPNAGQPFLKPCPRLPDARAQQGVRIWECTLSAGAPVYM